MEIQEYFIRHVDGYALSTEGEKDRVIKCLEAAIERRVCEVKLSLKNKPNQTKRFTLYHFSSPICCIMAGSSSRAECREQGRASVGYNSASEGERSHSG